MVSEGPLLLRQLVAGVLQDIAVTRVRYNVSMENSMVAPVLAPGRL